MLRFAPAPMSSSLNAIPGPLTPVVYYNNFVITYDKYVEGNRESLPRAFNQVNHRTAILR